MPWVWPCVSLVKPFRIVSLGFPTCTVQLEQVVSFGGRDALGPPGEGLPHWGCSASRRLELRPPASEDSAAERILSIPYGLSPASQPQVNPPGDPEVLSGKASCLGHRDRKVRAALGQSALHWPWCPAQKILSLAPSSNRPQSHRHPQIGIFGSPRVFSVPGFIVLSQEPMLCRGDLGTGRQFFPLSRSCQGLRETDLVGSAALRTLG